MAGTNTNLRKAQHAKNDEFYTQLTDVSKEMVHYKEHFKDKIVYCNCDNPTWSAFWKYFHLNFAELGLKKLISTHYDREEVTYKMEYTGGYDNNIEVGVKTPLEGNGDFRSDECVAFLDESDIVVTNPPFSLFREYVGLLLEHNKDFLIIGSMNAITYKELFPYLKTNTFWLGNSSPKEFLQPDGTIKKFGNILWYTNLDHNKRHETIETTYKYSKKGELYPELYPVFDELPDVINVNKVAEIPMDYEGIMAVPITFLAKYNPEQFEILDMLTRYTVMDYFGVNANVQSKHSYCCSINGNPIFARIAIRKKVGENDN